MLSVSTYMYVCKKDGNEAYIISQGVYCEFICIIIILDDYTNFLYLS